MLGMSKLLDFERNKQPVLSFFDPFLMDGSERKIYLVPTVVRAKARCQWFRCNVSVHPLFWNFWDWVEWVIILGFDISKAQRSCQFSIIRFSHSSRWW